MTAGGEPPAGRDQVTAGPESADERTRRFIEELDAVEGMTSDERRAELRRMAVQDGFLGAIATAALIRDRAAG